MTDRAPFPDVAAAMLTGLSDLAPTGIVTPPDLQESLPFLRIERTGGSDNSWTDTATIPVDAFASTYQDARDLAESVRQRLLTWPVNLGGVQFDHVTTLTAPNEVPWSTDQSIHRFTATYRVTVRR